ncbi:exonuclease V subunit alpha [Desulfovibrio aerotolerans]|uniref:Exonuclease V subunit alpha n=1 Tax=Solidesulfovibrio aerotolerans TaxID=295255 RepID=A0A7C9MYQ6_9BACT|nr:exonuclease V subunit alpha [Solidesulfovibrio aerotolerans]MYL81757.1 exonuclease V subunit alpha [Solidesulfovibrio aerotolerans]
MTETTDSMLDTAAYLEALDFVRGLRAPGKPLGFPDYAQYIRLVAERVVIDLDAYEGELNDFQELPEPYELAYLTVRLERLQQRIKAEKGIDVSVL